jgi:hypothetical protein
LVYAQEPSQTVDGETTLVWQIEELANILVRFLSRWWILIAFLAGKVLTNEFVYGAPLWFDVILWRLWQVIRSFANFTLGFLFVFYILRNFLWRIDTTQLKQKVFGIIGAAILVQASWFMIAVLIDFSTIWIAAISSLPMTIMENTWPQMQASFPIEKKIYVKDILKPDLNAAQETIDNQTWRTLEQLLPQADTVSWPLLFLWASVISATKMTVASADNISSAWWVAAITIIKAVWLIMFTIPLVGLLIVGLMRIFYIWLRAILSPVIVIDYMVLNEVLANKGDLKKFFNVKDLISLIFQPVIIVWVIVLALLFTIGMASLLMGGQDEEEEKRVEKILWIEIIQNNNLAKVWPNDIAPIYVKGKLLESTQQFIWWFIGQSILLFFTIFMTWTILKLSMKWWAIVGDILGKLSQTWESLLKAMPIPWTWVWIWALEAAKDSWINTLNKVAYANRAAQEKSEIQDYINKKILKNNVTDLSQDLERSIKETSIMNNTNLKTKLQSFANFFTQARKNLKDGEKLEYSNSPRFKEAINSILTNQFIESAINDWLLDWTVNKTEKPAELVKNASVTHLLENLMDGKVITKTWRTTNRKMFDSREFWKL